MRDGLFLGFVMLLASCASIDAPSVRPPRSIWLKRGCDEVRSPYDNLDDMRDAPGGQAIVEWRLTGCVGFPPEHVPGGFVARHVGYPGVPDQQYTATGAREERDQIVWFEYGPWCGSTARETTQR